MPRVVIPRVVIPLQRSPPRSSSNRHAKEAGGKQHQHGQREVRLVVHCEGACRNARSKPVVSHLIKPIQLGSFEGGFCAVVRARIVQFQVSKLVIYPSSTSVRQFHCNVRKQLKQQHHASAACCRHSLHLRLATLKAATCSFATSISLITMLCASEAHTTITTQEARRYGHLVQSGTRACTIIAQPVSCLGTFGIGGADCYLHAQRDCI